MLHDVELLRALLLELEARQVSPRATIIIVISEEAQALDLDEESTLDCLNVLLDLGYIEGPGPDMQGVWLFRKLTQKGNRFLEAARDPADWEAMKRRREQGRALRG